jgi:hypothetical protein
MRRSYQMPQLAATSFDPAAHEVALQGEAFLTMRIGSGATIQYNARLKANRKINLARTCWQFVLLAATGA